MNEKLKQIIREEIKKVLDEGSSVNKADNEIYHGLIDLRKAIEKEKPDAYADFKKVKSSIDSILSNFYKKHDL